MEVVAPKKSNCAFTLIELLVVIAVIAILAALIFPSMASAKARSRTTSCANNLRQWGMAFRMYADDNDDYLPRRGQGVQVLFQIDRPDDWFNALPRYFGSETFQTLVLTGKKPAAHDSSVFICPTAEDPGETYFLPYCMNMNLCPWSLPRASKFAEVIQPANVVAMADASGPYASTFPSTKSYSPVARHAERVNLLFLAGQVEAFSDSYVGCGVGDPKHDDVRWLTGTASDPQAVIYQ